MRANATIGKGKTVHATESGKTLCGSEFGHSKNGTPKHSLLSYIGQDVNCKACLKIDSKPAPSIVATINYGPNARENFTAMMIASATEAAANFWSRKIAQLAA